VKAKYSIGDVVRTVAGSALQGEGPIREINIPTLDQIMLWGVDDIHYIFKDNESGEFISVIERGIEKV
jgi:hypothetical protein